MFSHEVALTCYLLLFCLIYSTSNGGASAENVPENHGESNEDTPQFHEKLSQERSHLLAHLADRMDLDGEGLRHIQKHLGQQTGDTEQNKDLRDVADGDNAKGIFYFFKFHDYDDNQKLDGLEWMQALTDFHEEDNKKGEFKEGGTMFLEHEAEAIVDELLSKHDKNDDGMIDFIELMNSNVNSIMTELDKMQPGEDTGHDTHEQQQQNVEQSSLEQEFYQHQQAHQDHSQQEQNQEQKEDQKDNQQTQGNQQQQQDNQQLQEHQQQEQQPQEDQQQAQQPQEDPQHEQQSQEDQQQNQQPQEDQQQEQDNQQHQKNDQQEPNSEETQDHRDVNQDQGDSQQQNEPSSLEEEYNRQQQH